LHAAGQTQGAENTVFSFAYPGKKAMPREIFPGKFYASGKIGSFTRRMPLANEKIVSHRRWPREIFMFRTKKWHGPCWLD
jgi:hypothetical protein